MNKDNQQIQALDYFRKHAEDWKKKASGSTKRAKVNVIQQRNDFVLKVADESQDIKTFLDVGCGTGDLVCALAKKGIASLGIDYAQEMIDLSLERKRVEEMRNASFVCESIFDYDMPKAYFDLISANGFIEYLSYEELKIFFDLISKAIVPGGSFIVGSRNRLFNLMSMNAFTLEEVESLCFEKLVREATFWASADNFEDLDTQNCVSVQSKQMSHSNTGIDVSTRFQYTPLQLIGLLKEKGWHVQEIYPVHVHGVTTSFGKNNVEMHVQLANFLQLHARRQLGLLPQASTFMLHVRKDHE